MTKHTLLRKTLAALLLAGSGLSGWAISDVAQTPLVTAQGNAVKPNLMFLIDDSGSMAETYLPEPASAFALEHYGKRAVQCNGLAYEPDTGGENKYPPPLKFDGSVTPYASTGGDLFDANKELSSYANLAGERVLGATVAISLDASVPADRVFALASPFPGSSAYAVGGPVTLYSSTTRTNWLLGVVKAWSSSTGQLTVAVDARNGTGTLDSPRVARGWPHFVVWKYKGSEVLRNYTYTSAGAVIKTTNFYKECATVAGLLPAKFTRHIVAQASDAEKQRFANWYAFYRTRLAMIKTVSSYAFATVDEKFRVGLSTIHNKSAREATGNKFLHVRDFDATQKKKFYEYLMALGTISWTPNRAALAFAGRYFGNRANNQDLDPVQYWCQDNFTLLATDGAWNPDGESSDFGPFTMRKNAAAPASSNVTVGQRDARAPLGKRDAANDSGSGGSANSLADVAYYYANTDLRDDEAWGNCTGAISGQDVCANSDGQPDSPLKPQRMVTYTLSLGQDGSLKYVDNYQQNSADYLAIVAGARDWPNPTTDAFKVDDLWHAAVNGDGRYFNGSDPQQITNGMLSTLKSLEAISGSGAAAATSSLYPVPGNNQFFVAQYTTQKWSGDVKSYGIDVNTGALITKDEKGDDKPKWSAAAELNKMAPADRRIFFGSAMKSFTYGQLDTALKVHFDNQCTKLSQCLLLSATEKVTANSGLELVEYLRGTNYPEVFRVREGKLGDIVGSSPAYDGPVTANYKDAGYSTFVERPEIKARQGVVYVGANDGMLHALNADTGKELWAFVPTAVMPNMYRLADNTYYDKHLYYVDAPPLVADIKTSAGVWKRIVVFGLGAGGKSYVALDVTDALNPKYLWEFTDATMGLTHAKPVVTKRSDGAWVVVVPSGLANSDGKGYLYLLNAGDGTVVKKVPTLELGELGPATGWVGDVGDNTSLRYYAGDTEGNLWRFDTDNLVQPHGAALKLASLKDGTAPQPITTKPTVAEVVQKGTKVAVVYVGTGRLVGVSDLSNDDQQSIYAIKDPLTSEGWGDLRTQAVKQPLVTTGSIRRTDKSKALPVDWSLKPGWFVDLPDARERINVPMLLQGNTLVAGANVPNSVSSCANKGGYGWLYNLNIADGVTVGDAELIPGSLVVGLTAYYTQGTPHVIVNTSQSGQKAIETPRVPAYLTTPRRANWRELSQQGR